MSGLVINLRPYEKCLIGGVVIQNGQRRSQIRILDSAQGVLRLSDALHPDRIKTPLTRAYHAAQTVLVGDAPQSEIAPLLQQFLSDSIDVYRDFELTHALGPILVEAKNNNYYKVIKLLKPLLSEEAAVIYHIEKSRDGR